ncbi:hypothetical protein MTO96_023353 [Rhipicephalus appendiculatus]
MTRLRAMTTSVAPSAAACVPRVDYVAAGRVLFPKQAICVIHRFPAGSEESVRPAAAASPCLSRACLKAEANGPRMFNDSSTFLEMTIESEIPESQSIIRELKISRKGGPNRAGERHCDIAHRAKHTYFKCKHLVSPLCH